MYFFVFVILVSTQLANAHDDQVDLKSSSFKPSVFVAIGILFFMFSLIYLLIMYPKICHREPPSFHLENANDNHSNRGMFGTYRRFSGLNIEVVESLPFFRFSSLKGAKQGLQCSVCLTEFEDVDILRILPKCKHGFHIECIDQWLEKHSTCPLCRQKVASDDLNMLISSNSMRLGKEGKPDLGEASSSFEIFVEKEGDNPSRVTTGDSFRRTNHQIVVLNVVFKNRWSNVSSSDMMYLNSELLLGFTSSSSANMMGDRMFEQNLSQIKMSNSTSTSKTDVCFDNSREYNLISADKRAMSEITALSRFMDLKLMKNKLRQCLIDPENDDKNVRGDIKRRRKWLSITKRTVQWFANRENMQQKKLQSEEIGQTLDV